MHPVFRSALFTSACVVAVAVPVAAQRVPAVPAPRIYGGVSVGSHSLPRELQVSCAAGSFAAAEARVGVRSGAVALEVRGARMGRLSEVVCAVDQPDLLYDPPMDGVHAGRDYTFRQERPGTALDARLRVSGTGQVPVTASVGAGRLPGPGVSYLLASVGVRTPGAVRFAMDVERSWYRVRYDEVMREWEGGSPVREVSRERRSAWWNGTGFRLGVDMDLF